MHNAPIAASCFLIAVASAGISGFGIGWIRGRKRAFKAVLRIADRWQRRSTSGHDALALCADELRRAVARELPLGEEGIHG